jgi:hypothetical protein
MKVRSTEQACLGLFLGAFVAGWMTACGARSGLYLGSGEGETPDTGVTGVPEAGVGDAPQDAGGTEASADAAAATPRAIAPLSTSTVTSQTPTLRWVLADGEDGAVVDICGDRACTIPVTSFQASGTSSPPPTALGAGVYYWRLHGVTNGVVKPQTSPVWEFFVGARSAPVNTSWGTTLDVNGDGYADVIVAALGATFGATYVYLGGVGGLSATPNTVIGSGGLSVASAGDVNGDGFADVVVGDPTANGDTGAAYVYLGGPGGLSTTPSTVPGPGGPFTQPGPPLPGPVGYFAESVASAGDVNGDGYADVIVGAQEGELPGNTGVAYVYLGGTGGLSTVPTVLTGPGGSGGDFGVSVASAGDVNGDGFADVIVGASGVNNMPTTGQSVGAAYVYLGGPGGLSTTPTVLAGPGGSGGSFGYSVASAGDVNGDGLADVIVGAFALNDFVGAAYMYLGAGAGLSTAPIVLTDPSGPASGGPNASFGWSVASAGDVNGDGFADVIVGASTENGYAGAAYVYLGRAGGLSTTPTTLTAPGGPGGYFGAPVASAGDVNEDGFADVIVGAGGVENNVGAAYAYLGGAGGLSTTPTVLTSPAGPSGYFGYSVASAGNAPRGHTEGSCSSGTAVIDVNYL